MSYCPNCGTQNAEGANFCVNCGAGLSPSVPAQQLTRGSKVTFVGSNGKTYSGTVKEVDGERYRVKYDVFHPAAWLYRNQFNVVGTAPPPVATHRQNPDDSYRAASTYVAPARSTTRVFFMNPAFWGSLMIIGGFFTNWLNYRYGNITGWTILTTGKDIIQAPDKNHIGIFLLGALVMIALSAIICFLYAIRLGRRPAVFSFFKILPLLIIVAFGAFVIVKATNNAGEFDLPVDSSSWRILGVGSYLTLIGSFILAMSGSRK